MCVVVYKPKNKKMPKEDRLLSCFVSNPDGAGYMFQNGKNVTIKKGFMTFNEFYKSLMQDYNKVGKRSDFVLHFRISTQGGVNKPCCHPYKISKNMDELRELECNATIGMAHNGIISLTTESSYTYNYNNKWSGYLDYEKPKPNYNDTMKFITDYMSLIIRNPEDIFDEDKIELIEKLIGASNKFAVMTPTDVKLIGYFQEIDGIYYSNNYFTYRETSTKTNTKKSKFLDYKDEFVDITEDGTEMDYYTDEKEDYLNDVGCGYAGMCRNCKRFEECYGFDFPEEWEDLSDEDIDNCLDYFYEGYSSEGCLKLIEADKDYDRTTTKDM